MRNFRQLECSNPCRSAIVKSSRTALIVVDVQNDFVDPDGNLSVEGAASVVPSINDKVSAAISKGQLIVYTQDWHPEVTPHFAKDGGIWPVHCVAESWGAAFYPKLDVAVDAEIVRKGTGGEDGYSGFSVRDPETETETDTAMESILNRYGVQTVEVVGIATDYCVKETAIDASTRGFNTVAYRSCMKGVDLQPGDSEKAINEMISAGVEVRDA